MSAHPADVPWEKAASPGSRGGGTALVPRACSWLVSLTLLCGITARGQSKVFGFDFSPLVNGQSPGSYVTPEQIRVRLRMIAPYTVWVRTYSSLNGLDQVCPIAHQMGLKCAAGASIYGSAVDTQELASLENLAASGYVDLAVIGTEAVYRQNVLAQTLAGMIAQFRAAAPGVPVTTADTYQSYLDNPSLVSAVDLVYLNVYPYFESVSLQNSPSWVNAWYRIVAAAASPKSVWISETGWPGSSNSDAASYFLSLESWARAENVNLFYFEALNEIWKGGLEATFGVFNQYGVMKPGMAAVFNGTASVDTWGGNSTPGGTGTPAITFTHVPPIGVQDVIRGTVLHVRPADYKVVCYIYAAGQWYVKPYGSRPYTPILATDGTWSCSAPSDTGETQIAALLLANGTANGSFIHDLSISVASVITARTNAAIYGNVHDQTGNGIDGVTVTLSGNSSQTTVTTGGGSYAFVTLPPGSYSVSATMASASITPSTLNFPNLSNVQSGDFLVVTHPFSASGNVADKTGNALSGVSLSLGSPYVVQTITDPFGYYTLSGVVPSSSITVIPAAPGYEFIPSSISFPAVSSNVTANFVGHPVLSIVVSHSGEFAAGQTAATYSMSVTNTSATTTTSGTVTVSETVPAGLTFGSMTGTGWSCTGNTCSRSDALAPGATYPPLVVTAGVSANAASVVVNRADLSGGGSAASTALDSTVISPYPATLTASPNPSRLGQPVTLNLTLPSAATGRVTFYSGTNILGITKVTVGKATLSTNSLLPFGSSSIVARYSGDPSFVALTTIPALHQVTATAVAAFALASTSPVGAYPGYPAIADLNADGRMDVIVPSWDYNYVSVLLGNGDGTFLPASNVPVGSAPTAVVVADFNSDGIPDCAVTNRNSGNVTILLGNGNGTFRTQGNIGSLSLPAYIGAADFNNDGYADIAVASGNSGVANIEVFLGNGDGTFQAQLDVPTGRIDGSTYSFGFAIADFDGDGIADIVDANLQNGFTILLGTGTGGFIPWGAYTWTGGVASPVLVGDFNGDGAPDLFTGTGTVYLGNGDATFTKGQNYGQQYGYAISDFNGDGNADILAASGVMLGAGDGTFFAPVSLGANGVVADFNGDGRPDVLSITDSSALMYLGQAAQTINFGALSNVTFGLGTLTLAATASSGLAVNFTSTTTNVCTVTGAALTLVSAGTCSITASQTGSTNYASATPVTQSFIIAPAAQTISFGTLSNVPFSLGTIALTATASSGLAVNFTSTTTNVCAVRDATFTLKTVGTCSITASQGGDGRYAAATPVTRSFTISAAICDINGDGTTNVADAQLIINEALGVVPAFHDLNGDGAVNVADVQKVINAALGLGCAAQ